jgi:hypothetical protein
MVVPATQASSSTKVQAELIQVAHRVAGLRRPSFALGHFHRNNSIVQINSHGEQLSTEETDGGGVAGAARDFFRKPALTLASIIFGK